MGQRKSMARQLRRTPKVVWKFFRETFVSFSEDHAMRLSAALAYYSIFSLAPLVLLAAGLAGWIFGEETVHQEVERQLAEVMGARATQAVEAMMEAWKKSGSGTAALFGITALVLGASGVFGQLQDALNTIWKVKAKPKRNLWHFVRDRFLSLTMVLGTGFLLLVSMILTTLLNAFAKRIGTVVPFSEGAVWVLNYAVSFGLITVLFAMIFKFLPDARIPWRNVAIGAVGTSLLFTVGKELLGLYLGRESTVSAYGAAGSLVVIVLWVYYASLILLLGAEFTRTFSRLTDSRPRPSEYAVRAAKND
jgi:membrane protein